MCVCLLHTHACAEQIINAQNFKNTKLAHTHTHTHAAAVGVGGKRKESERLPAVVLSAVCGN